jgi:hypothetical protein
MLIRLIHGQSIALPVAVNERNDGKWPCDLGIDGPRNIDIGLGSSSQSLYLTMPNTPIPCPNIEYGHGSPQMRLEVDHWTRVGKRTESNVFLPEEPGFLQQRPNLEPFPTASKHVRREQLSVDAPLRKRSMLGKQ